MLGRGPAAAERRSQLADNPTARGYVTDLAHILSHVSAASVPPFCFPDEHIRALACMCAQTARCGSVLPALKLRFVQPSLHLKEFAKVEILLDAEMLLK